MFGTQATPSGGTDLLKGAGIGAALHLFTWASLFAGVLPTTLDAGTVLRLYPGLFQWAYLLPASWLAKNRNRPSISRGIWAFGVAALLANIVVAAVLDVRR